MGIAAKNSFLGKDKFILYISLVTIGLDGLPYALGNQLSNPWLIFWRQPKNQPMINPGNGTWKRKSWADDDIDISKTYKIVLDISSCWHVKWMIYWNLYEILYGDKKLSIYSLKIWLFFGLELKIGLNTCNFWVGPTKIELFPKEIKIKILRSIEKNTNNPTQTNRYGVFGGVWGCLDTQLLKSTPCSASPVHLICVWMKTDHIIRGSYFCQSPKGYNMSTTSTLHLDPSRLSLTSSSICLIEWESCYWWLFPSVQKLWCLGSLCLFIPFFMYLYNLIIFRQFNQ